MREIIKSLIDISILYFQNLIKVIPIQGNNIFPQNWYSPCLNVQVPLKDQTLGVPNSDLHLYITYIDNPYSSVLSSASFCAVDPILKRPTFGRIQYNIGILISQISSNEKFENRVETTIHEMLHVLGFSQFSMPYWIDPSTKSFYGQTFRDKILTQRTIRNLTTDILYSQNVLQTTRKYYDCENLEGMQLENQGGQGSVGSHWERTILLNEIMTAESIPTQAPLSIFTIALLKDTGFYQDVNENFSSKIKWGKGRGCDFFQSACKSQTVQYQEFVESQQPKGCSYENDGYGTGVNTLTTDGCYFMISYSNKICNSAENNNLSSNKYMNERLETFGADSRCLNSTLSFSNYIFNDSNRCHQIKCAEDLSSIAIFLNQINKQITCTKENALLNIQTDQGIYIGTITCPQNFKQFCNYEPVCKNACNKKGICIKGQCMCLQGYANEDCSIQCPKYSENGLCVDFCTYASTQTQQCIQCNILGCLQCQSEITCTQCAQNYRLVGNTCTLCIYPCLTCLTSNSTQCLSCQNTLQVLYNYSCLNDCPVGTYLDLQTRVCNRCVLEGCLECSSFSTCTKCDAYNNYILETGKCIRSSCDTPCITCLSTNKSSCNSCMNGMYLFFGSCYVSCPLETYPVLSTKTCKWCQYGCLKCTNDNTCYLCDSRNGYQLFGSICVTAYVCYSPCRTCKSFQPDFCLSCQTGYYLYENKCYTYCPNNGSKPTSGIC
ncbi:leishmanolysin family protein, putative [Ichthyophthirius multifiliis]|uniref:Leishmanolysin family protein, putative n=1 Tax=Ichthyophthirius multifiliis TaxID=5932 RepID=G0QLD8_ICHMU|nr:leishmanolysin family protein, putative [Ichthyophthirius multifiliis]EGR33968.1 leishmanolysin family protein, putative [Ichthyophthirius multifiliis]|eukprot:XP_004039272.1 leishmanolysin family protein, putative [Ichthyophthirius multifiliis]